MDHAMQIMKALHNVILNFDNPEEITQALDKLGKTHCPKKKTVLERYHNQEVGDDSIDYTCFKPHSCD